MIIYRDSEYRCHIDNPQGLFTAFETAFFDGKCAEYIEGFMYFFKEEQWTYPDGYVYLGEMAVPWRRDDELAAAQRQYELMMAEAAAAYREGVDSV